MTSKPPNLDFIRQIVAGDIAAGKHGGAVVTRFPPEPNGYLHIGHAKSICLNFGVAQEFNGACNLRFDDTNPLKEDEAYVDSIQRDVEWLGFKWAGEVRYASDYFEQLYDYGVELIKLGHAYVCDLSADEVRRHRGTLTEPGVESPNRDRAVEENLDLFARMRAGEFPDGARTLRAKIDMASPNVNMRDPTLFRIRHAHHQRTGDRWCIYPMYDYTHCLSDAIEGVTHSLCTLEFEDHRPLYDWVLETLRTPKHPQQIEFSRLNLEYTVMSKRMLNLLVDGGYVDGWDDPRMLTISGLRRRGFTPQSIREFCARIGITKKDNTIEMGLLESAVRDDLGERAPRAMAVLNPLKLIIDDYPEQGEDLIAQNHPNRPELGERRLPFSRELWIERDDFMVDPPKKFHRLGPGREVRLRYAYIVKCESFQLDDEGNVTEVHCTYDELTKSGTNTGDNRKVKGTIHWVDARTAVTAEVRLYDRLFSVPNPAASVTRDADRETLGSILNPQSLVTLADAKIEPGLAALAAESNVQFERQGYFCVDRSDSTPAQPVFNRTVTLRDSWAKIEKQHRAGSN
ncbi:MAG: glutamine--tRNA ligase/YqeY domain fusion protein [Pseudomonadota bacterium]